MKKFILVLGIYLFACSSIVNAGLQEGVDAMARGDYEVALREFRLLADVGDEAGEYNLGVMYETGRGVNQDYSAALSRYRKGVEKNYPPSFYSIGNLYLNGMGVNADKKEAMEWFKQSGERGYAPAQFRLGFIYEGYGEPVEARKWYEKAAYLRYSKAMYQIGELDIRKVKRSSDRDDLVDAYKWYTLALLHGVDRAEFDLIFRIREKIAGMLEPREILEAASRARKWLDESESVPAILASNKMAGTWLNEANAGDIYSSPELRFSDYLEWKSTDFVFDFDSGTARGGYSVSVASKPSLPDKAYLEVVFENPVDAFKPFVVDQVLDKERGEIAIESPHSSGFTCGSYRVIFNVYEDNTKSNLLGRLRIVVKSMVNTNEVKSQLDLLEKMKKFGHAC